MKRAILILILILAVIFVVLSVLGSGGEYAAEKLFYRAMKANTKVVVNPDVAPPPLLARVEGDLKKLIAKYPTAHITKIANIALVEFYTAHKNYDKALDAISGIMKTYKSDDVIMSTVHFMKGVIYEKRNNWPKALAEFQMLHDKYPYSQLGVQMPIYIAKYYDSKGQDAEARSAYSEARSFYGKIEKDHTGKNLGFIASTLLLQTYINTRNYEEAGRILEETMNTYMGQPVVLQLLPQVENIFVTKLNNPQKAVEIYKSINEKIGDGKLRKALQKRIDELLNKKPVSVSKS
jgi:tetratricopeptide (TPR) repeat protein